MPSTPTRCITTYSLATDGWIRAFPVGTYYRNGEKLHVTPKKLKDVEANFKAGRPGYKVGVNIEHKDGVVGRVEDAEYRDGDEPGLYIKPDAKATEFLKSGSFGYVSPEVVWQEWEDATTGKRHNNVLVGLAATNYPFFGGEVAVFSDIDRYAWDDMYDGGMFDLMDLMQRLDRSCEQCGDEDAALLASLNNAKEAVKRKLGGLVAEFKAQEGETYRDFTPDERRAMAESGEAMPDGGYPIASAQDLKNAIQAAGRAKNPAMVKKHIIKRAKALKLTRLLPEDWTNTMNETTRDAYHAHSDEVLDSVGKIGAFLRWAKKTFGPDEVAAIETAIEDATEPGEGEPTEATDTGKKTAAKNSARPMEVADVNDNAQRFTALEQERRDLADKLSALEVRNVALEQAVGAQQYRADLAEMERFCIQFNALGTSASFATDMLSWKRKLGDDEFTKLVAYLKSANAAVATSDLFTRRSQRPTVEQDALGQFETAVSAYMSKHNVDRVAAMSAVARENPALYNETQGKGR